MTLRTNTRLTGNAALVYAWRGFRLRGIGGGCSKLLVVLWLIAALAASASADSSGCPVDLTQRFAAQKSQALPWDNDTLGRSWAQRPKYFLIIGVTAISGVPSKDDDFAKVDVKNVASVLCQLGYAPVPNAPNQAVLGGSGATRDNLLSALEKTGDIPSDDPLLVLYFSGHGIPGSNPDDLYLPLYDSKSLTITQSQSLRDLLAKLRSTYQGNLVVVLDACFSGTAAVGGLLKSVDDFRSTAILTSSSADEKSYALSFNSTKESAFTHYFVEAIKAGGEVRDGLSLLGDVHTFLKAKLIRLYSDPNTPPDQKLPQPMTPDITQVGTSMMIAYSRQDIQQPNTNRRFVEQARAKIISQFNLKTLKEADLPGSIRILAGNTVLAEYAVKVDRKGSRVLEPTAFAPAGTEFDVTTLRALAVPRTPDSSGQFGLIFAEPLVVDGLVANKSKLLKLDRSAFDHTLAVTNK